MKPKLRTTPGTSSRNRRNRSYRRGCFRGPRAAKPFIKALCEAQADLAARAAKPTVEFPVFLDYQDDVYAAVEAAAADKLAAVFQIADKQDRDNASDELKDEVLGALAGQFEGREKELSAAFRSVTKHVVRQRILKDQVRIDGRGLTDIRQLTAEVEVLPPCSRFRDLRARRNPDHGRHHAEHAQDGAADRLVVAGNA